MSETQLHREPVRPSEVCPKPLPSVNFLINLLCRPVRNQQLVVGGARRVHDRKHTSLSSNAHNQTNPYFEVLDSHGRVPGGTYFYPTKTKRYLFRCFFFSFLVMCLKTTRLTWFYGTPTSGRHAKLAWHSKRLSTYRLCCATRNFPLNLSTTRALR